LKIKSLKIKSFSLKGDILSLFGEGFYPYINAWIYSKRMGKKMAEQIKVIDDEHAICLFDKIPYGTLSLYISSLYLPGWSIFDKFWHVFEDAIKIKAKEGIKVYPNPAKGVSFITFSSLPTPCTITIYTISGTKVCVLRCDREQVMWHLLNEAGEMVSSGIYLYQIKDDEWKIVKEGKLCIIR
jgi:hypothetical protein